MADTTNSSQPHFELPHARKPEELLRIQERYRLVLAGADTVKDMVPTAYNEALRELRAAAVAQSMRPQPAVESPTPDAPAEPAVQALPASMDGQAEVLVFSDERERRIAAAMRSVEQARKE